MLDFLLFTVQEKRFAVPLTAVRRVVRMVEVTSLPDSPDTIDGVINFHGTMVPVLAFRHRCGLPPRPPLPSDHLIIATTGDRTIALPVDATDDVVTLAEEQLLPLDRILPEEGRAGGIAAADGDIVLICDLENFLAPVAAGKKEPADDAPP